MLLGNKYRKTIALSLVLSILISIFSLTLSYAGALSKTAVSFLPFSEIAAGKMLTADGTQVGYSPSYAVDGNNQSKWRSASLESGQTLTLDLGGLYEINEISLLFPQSLNLNFIVEVTDYPTRWFMVSDNTVFGTAAPSLTLGTRAAAVRYIRFTLYSVSLGSAFEISEISVKGRCEEFLATVPKGPDIENYPRPVAAPVPALTAGVSSNVLLLDGQWKALIPENLAAFASVQNTWSNGKPCKLISWAQPVKVASIYIYDTAGAAIPLNEAVVSFSDGTSVTVSNIPADGRVRRMSFAEKTVSEISIEPASYENVNMGGVIVKVFAAMPGGYWDDSADTSGWKPVSVPRSFEDNGEAFDFTGPGPPSFDVEIPYRRAFTVPSDFGGKRIILKIDKAPTFSRVWLDGRLVALHETGYSQFDVDITGYVQAGAEHILTIGTTNEKNSVELPFYFGLSGSVSVVAYPKTSLAGLAVLGTLDDNFQNGILDIRTSVLFGDSRDADITLSLKDKNGVNVPLATNVINVLSNNDPCFVVDSRLVLNIPDVDTWDAENPNLYTLTASLSVGGSVVSVTEHAVGFRTIVFDGNKMLVNGNEVKLRGMSTFFNLDSRFSQEDALKKLKEANVNCIITTHFPLEKSMINLCDRMGMYVVVEPLGFILGNVPNNSYDSKLVDDPLMTGKFLEAISECIETFYSNPSVFMYAIGDEAWYWGENAQKTVDYIHAADPTRKWLFNFDMKLPESVRETQDIVSYHYPKVRSEVWGGLHVPHFYDQCTTITHCNIDILADDPGTRNQYDEVVTAFWEKVFTTEGALGGTIWNIVDDTGGRPWGMLDVWGREKPEFWAIKKGFSPIRIDESPLGKPADGQPVVIPVKNWFDSTNFSDLRIEWSVGESSGILENIDINPHDEGTLTIPVNNLKNGDIIELRFYKSDAYMENQLIDGFDLRVGEFSCVFEPLGSGNAPSVVQSGGSITVSGQNFSITFDESTGKITSGTLDGTIVLTGGPHLNLGVYKTGAWSADSVSAYTSDGCAVIRSTGTYGGSIGCEFTTKIDVGGLISTTYKITNPPPYYDVYTNTTGYTECGVYYTAPDTVGGITWLGDSKWSYYPDTHIGRPSGSAPIHRLTQEEEVYNQKITAWGWELDEKDFRVSGRYAQSKGTNDFRSSKWNLWFADLILNDGKRLRLEGDGTVSARAQIISGGQVRYNLNNQWAVPANSTTDAGDAARDINIRDGYTDTINMRLTADKSIYAIDDILSGIDAQSVDSKIKTVVYDLGEVKTFDTVSVDGGLKLYYRQYENNDRRGLSDSRYTDVDFPDYHGYPREYTVSVSIDNAVFSEVLRETGGNGREKTHAFSPVSARYVKISVLASDTEVSHLSSFNTYSGNYEIGGGSTALNIGSSVSYVFNGSSVTWKRGSGSGVARVYIDGAFMVFSTGDFTKHGLSDGAHEIKIVSDYGTIYHSGFEISVTEKIESWDSRVTYSKKTPGSPGASGNGAYDLYDDWFWDIWSASYDRRDARTGFTTGVNAQLRFSGTGVRWFGAKTYWGGSANVWIDGVFKGTAYFQANDPVYHQLVFEVTGLADGEHTLYLETLSNGTVDVDWFERIYTHEEELCVTAKVFNSVDKQKLSVPTLGKTRTFTASEELRQNAVQSLNNGPYWFGGVLNTDGSFTKGSVTGGYTNSYGIYTDRIESAGGGVHIYRSEESVNLFDFALVSNGIGKGGVMFKAPTDGIAKIRLGHIESYGNNNWAFASAEINFAVYVNGKKVFPMSGDYVSFLHWKELLLLLGGRENGYLTLPDVRKGDEISFVQWGNPSGTVIMKDIAVELYESLTSIRLDGNSVFSMDSGIVSGIPLEITPHELEGNFECPEQLNFPEGVMTGAKVTLQKNAGATDSVTLAVTGDVHADGALNALDIIAMKKHMLGLEILDGACLAAAEECGGGSVDVSGIIRLKKMIVE